jgi:hypothetical protein
MLVTAANYASQHPMNIRAYFLRTKTSQFYSCFLLLASCFLTSCHRSPEDELPLDRDAEHFTPRPDNPMPKHLLVDLYVDGNASMSGFATQTMSDDHEYLKLTALVEKLGRSHFRNVFHEYNWKTDPAGNSAEFTGADRVMDPKFYAQQVDAKHAPVAALIEKKILSRRFTVVVTDLLWENGELDRFGDRMAQEIKDHDRAFGMVAAPLPFDGMLKVPGTQQSLSYRSLRRLYILFFGDRRVVEEFSEALKSEMLRQLIEFKSFLMEGLLLKKPVSERDAAIEHLVGCTQQLVMTGDKKQILQLNLVPSAAEGSMRIAFPLEIVPDSFTFGPNSIESLGDAYLWRGNRWKEMSTESLMMQSKATIEEALVDPTENRYGRRLIFEQILAPDVFYQDGAYYLDFKFRIKPWELKLPDWIGNANLDWDPERDTLDANQLGAHTPGLKRFLEQIRDKAMSAHEPVGSLRILLKRE